MDEKNVILEAMRTAGEPVNAGKVAELTGLDRKVVDKVFAQLKKEGAMCRPYVANGLRPDPPPPPKHPLLLYRINQSSPKS